MNVKYYESQDICLFLDNKEFGNLISKESKDFFDDNCIRGLSLEAEAYFFLGHCKNLIEIIAYGNQLDGGVQLVLPEEEEDSYFINLLPQSKAIKELKEKRFYSTPYPGGSKLMIKIQNAMD